MRHQKKSEKNGSYKQHFELDKTDLNEIKSDVIVPYLQGSQFQFDGYFINAKDVKRIVVKQKDKSTQVLSDYENETMPAGVIMFVSREDIVSYDKHTTDITKQVFASAKEKIDSDSVSSNSPKNAEPELDKSKVFIVHGHDNLAKIEVARFVEQWVFSPLFFMSKPAPAAQS